MFARTGVQRGEKGNEREEGQGDYRGLRMEREGRDCSIPFLYKFNNKKDEHHNNSYNASNSLAQHYQYLSASYRPNLRPSSVGKWHTKSQCKSSRFASGHPVGSCQRARTSVLGADSCQGREAVLRCKTGAVAPSLTTGAVHMLARCQKPHGFWLARWRSLYSYTNGSKPVPSTRK